jgi:dTDP-4-dehydrorhamnose reductase
LRSLIIGVDGSFGAGLSASLLERGHAVIGTTRRRENAAAQGSLFLDLAHPSPELPAVDVAVICAAMARFEDCRRNPELAHRINVAAPLEIARRLTQAGARVILLSTAAVFDCRTPQLDEAAPASPQSVYGRLKSEAETALLALGPQVSVLRLTKVLKPNAGILSSWIQSLGQGGTVRAFDDHCFCPLRVGDVVGAIAGLTERGEGGMYHVSGASDLSYADAAKFLAHRIGATNAKVDAVHGRDNGVNEGDLTPFTSLKTRRLSQLLGFEPPDPFDVIQDVHGRELRLARSMLAGHSG